MTYCDGYVELISAALDGALSPEEQARLDAHLTQCPDCKALYDDLTAIHQALRELPPVEVPAGLTDRILEAVANDNITALPKLKKSVFQWKRGLATAAVFALVLLGVGTLRGQLNATKSAAPEGFMPQFYSNETDEMAPMMADRTFEGAFNEEVQAPVQDYQEPSASADRMTNAAPPVEDATAQGAAKQSPASSPEVQTTGAQAPEPQPTEPPTESEADPETATFTIDDIPEDVTDPENTIDITGSLFVIPTPEVTDSEISAEGALDEEEPMAAMEPGEALALTREEALALVVERCFGNSGYDMVQEDLKGEPISCHVSLMDDDTFMTGGTIVHTEETEEFFFFECHWDDDPENPYHYSVHKTEGYVAWQGEVLGNEP